MEDSDAEASPSRQQAQQEEATLFEEGYAFEGAAVVALVQDKRIAEEGGEGGAAMAIVLEDGVTLTLDLDSGERRLNELGYSQTLKRDLTSFELFATGFACIGLFVGVVPYYGTAFSNGGPVAVVWYWWIISLFSTFIVASLAEIASSLPSAGSLYFWAAHLAPPPQKALAAWITGWLELVATSVGAGGEVLASVALIVDIIKISTSTYVPGSEGQEGSWEAPWVPNAAVQFGFSVFLMGAIAALNCCKVKTVGQFLGGATVFQILTAVAIMICVPAVAPTRQPSSFVFFTYLNNWQGVTPSAGYAFVLALLLPQYSQYAVDATAHISEETKKSDVTTPLAMLSAQVTAILLGWGVLVSMTYSIQDVPSLTSDNNVVGGTEGAFAQILFDAFSTRYGVGTGASVFLGFIWVGFLGCAVAQTLISSRVAYALARDGGLPFSRLFKRVDSRKVPVPAVALVCAIGIISLIPNMFSEVAYSSISSMSTTAWFASYIAPIAYRLFSPEEKFTPGPFYMARHIGTVGGKLVHFGALIYSLYTVCVFLLPSTFPITMADFNYAPIGIAVFAIFFLGWWVVDARKWFQGPIVTDVDKGSLEAVKQENGHVSYVYKKELS